MWRRRRRTTEWMERRDQSRGEQREGGEMLLCNYPEKQKKKYGDGTNLVTDFFGGMSHCSNCDSLIRREVIMNWKSSATP